MNAFGKVTKLVVASLTVATYVAASNVVEAPTETVGTASVPSTTPVKEGAKTESNLKGTVADAPTKEEGEDEVKRVVMASTDNLTWRVTDRVVSYLGASKLPKAFQSVYDDLRNNGGITIPNDILGKMKRLTSGPLPVDILKELADRIGTQLSTKYGVKENDMKSYVFNALRSPGILQV